MSAVKEVPGWQVHKLTVISSSKINRKVTQVLGFLKAEPKSKTDHGSIVAVSAKAPVASKLISVVEIVKRDLADTASSNPIRVYQYSALHGIPQDESRLVEPNKSAHGSDKGLKRKREPSTQPPGAKRHLPETTDAQQEGNDSIDIPREAMDEASPESDDDQYFEALEKAISSVEPKAAKSNRETPVLTIYLSLKPVATLQKAFGEQIAP